MLPGLQIVPAHGAGDGEDAPPDGIYPFWMFVSGWDQAHLYGYRWEPEPGRWAKKMVAVPRNRIFQGLPNYEPPPIEAIRPLLGPFGQEGAR